MRQLRHRSAIGGGATVVVVAWVVAASSGAAAAARVRSGTFRAQFASHVSPAGSTSSGLAATGAHVVAGVVATLALAALAFLVVTFVRRRTTPG